VCQAFFAWTPFFVLPAFLPHLTTLQFLVFSLSRLLHILNRSYLSSSAKSNA
jgi:hypothetical protein